MTRCKRPGCRGTVRELGGKFCSAKCAASTGWGKVNGHGRAPDRHHAAQAPARRAESWWVATDRPTFYREAHVRFPDTAPRGKVILYAKDSQA